MVVTVDLLCVCRRVLIKALRKCNLRPAAQNLKPKTKRMAHAAVKKGKTSRFKGGTASNCTDTRHTIPDSRLAE